MTKTQKEKEDFLTRYPEFPPNYTIQDAVEQTAWHIREEAEQGGRILVAISGGSDSDIMMDMFERVGYPPGLVAYIWYDTGLEYSATKKHLDELQNKYGIQIVRYRPKFTVAQSVRKFGVPFLSKKASMYLDRLQNHGFQFEDDDLETSLNKYGKCMSALRWWYSSNGPGRFSISEYAGLKEYLMQNPPPKISDKCCDYAKKNPAKKAFKEFGITLNCTGVRKHEGGARAIAYHSCFSEATPKSTAEFRPLFYFTDDDKKEYKEFCGIQYSDCYEVWGMTRTGCACCPFHSSFDDELALAKKWEPKLYAAAVKIFGVGYEYRRNYRAFKEEFKKQKRIKER